MKARPYMIALDLQFVMYLANKEHTELDGAGVHAAAFMEFETHMQVRKQC